MRRQKNIFWLRSAYESGNGRDEARPSHGGRRCTAIGRDELVSSTLGNAAVMSEPIICFGQQPCGFFPKRFLYAKFVSARRLQKKIGGKIVFFYHDGDHDPRETITTLRDRHSGHDIALNFDFASKVQKQFSPLYLKRIAEGWQKKMARQLPAYVSTELTEEFKAASGLNVADFCLDMYRQMNLLEGIRVERSSDPAFRERAVEVEDYFVDVPFEGEIVRARCRDGRLLLHKGGDHYIEVPAVDYNRKQITPTPIPDFAGCNQSSIARIMFPAPVNRITSTKRMAREPRS